MTPFLELDFKTRPLTRQPFFYLYPILSMLVLVVPAVAGSSYAGTTPTLAGTLWSLVGGLYIAGLFLLQLRLDAGMADRASLHTLAESQLAGSVALVLTAAFDLNYGGVWFMPVSVAVTTLYALVMLKMRGLETGAVVVHLGTGIMIAFMLAFVAPIFFLMLFGSVLFK